MPRRAFNQAILDTTTPQSDDDLRDAIARFDDTGLRYRVRLRDVAVEALSPRLEALGLVNRGGIPAMVFDGELPEAQPNSLTIEPVHDAKRLEALTAIVAEAFGWESEELAAVFRSALLDEPEWYGWVGYEDRAPVAASQLVTRNGIGGLFYVAVLGTHRRKGYGEAITRVAIEAAHGAGCDLITLNASQDGYPIYKRLGFRDVGKHIGYTPPDEEN
jgi:GNAT superfamily N-acetyltransferase